MATRISDAPLADNLKAALAERGMTQETLAREIGVSLRVVQAWCGGRSLPRWPRLVAVAAVLQQEPAWFYTDHEHAAA